MSVDLFVEFRIGLQGDYLKELNIHVGLVLKGLKSVYVLFHILQVIFLISKILLNKIPILNQIK